MSLSALHNTRLAGQFWLDKGEQGFLGARRIALLEAIAECGSISQAARSLKMSYKASWEAVEAMNNLADEPLVVRISGGRNGGGSHLTAQGHRTIEAYKLIEAEYTRFLARLSAGVKDLDQWHTLLRSLALKTSVRNQLRGHIIAIQRGLINSEVTLLLSSGVQITAILSNDGAETLGLTEGSALYALIKESSVMIGSDQGEIRGGAWNQFSGTVQRCHAGAAKAEVVMKLDGGELLTCVISSECVHQLGVREGARACALFKASDVILVLND